MAATQVLLQERAALCDTFEKYGAEMQIRMAGTPELIAAIKDSRVATWVAIHANHPRELTAEAQAALRKLADAGIPLVSQTVLLKGVNDDPEILAELDCRWLCVDEYQDINRAQRELVRLLAPGEAPPDAENVVVARLKDGRHVVASFASAPRSSMQS